MESNISPAVLAKAQKLMEKEEAQREKTRTNIAKYPHANPDTLQFDAASNKYSVEITCVKCGETRRVFTSDLFQVNTCLKCAATAKAEKKAAKKAELDEALAILRAQKA